MWKPCKYLESFSLSEGKGRIRFSVTYFNRSIDAPPWNPFSGAVIIRYCLLFLQALSRQQETILPFFLLWGSVPCWNTWNKLLALKCCCVFLILRFFSSKPRGHRRAAKGLWLLAGTFPPLPQGLGWHSGEGEVAGVGSCRRSGGSSGRLGGRTGRLPKRWHCWERVWSVMEREDKTDDQWAVSWTKKGRCWSSVRIHTQTAMGRYLIFASAFQFSNFLIFYFHFYDKASMLCQHS